MKRKDDHNVVDSNIVPSPSLAVLGSSSSSAGSSLPICCYSPSLKKQKRTHHHSYEKSSNSIFNLIFPNQWKNLFEFTNELLDKYDDNTLFLSQKLNRFSENEISNLKKYFLVIPPNAPNLESIIIDYHDTILQSNEFETDSQIYNNFKLQNSIIFKQQSKLSEIVDLIIESNFRIEDKPNHVLCNGFSKIRPNAS